MFSILLVLALQSSAFDINLTTLYPSFKSYDNGPYLDISTRSSSQLNLSISTETHLDIYLNYNFQLSLNISSNISLTLLPGFNILSILSDKETQILIPYSTQTINNHNISVAGTNCYTSDCGITNSNQLNLYVNTTGYIAKIFSLRNRDGNWQQGVVGSSNPFLLVAGENYLMLGNGGAAMVIKVFKSIDANQIVGLSLGNEEFYLEPRFTPSLTSYFVSPKVEFAKNVVNVLASSQGSNSNITFSSFLGAFVDFTVKSGTGVNISIGSPDDQITLTVKSGSSTTYYYYLKFTSKSRDKYLKRLELYSGSSDPLLSYPEIELCCNLSKIITNENFTQARTTYTIPDQDYSILPMSLIAEPSDSLSTLYLNNQSYLSNSKTYLPNIGVNTLALTVQAEDPNFFQEYQVTFYMKNNDSYLSELNISNIQPSFSPTIYSYRSYMPFETTSIPVFLQSSDPTSLIKFIHSSLSQMSTGNLSTTVVFNSLTTTVFITVSAETLSITSNYSVTFIRQDICGNGLRFTASEFCDDGNLVNNDGCSKNCTVEPGWSCSDGSATSKDICKKIIIDPNDPEPVCGNNKVEKGEECDDSKNKQCVKCKIVLSVCGNGVLESGEECDDGNKVNYDGCTNCKKDSNGNICGDGLRSPISNEECDDGNKIAEDGCTNCKIDQGWSCNDNSLLDKFTNEPDECWKNEESTDSGENSSDSSSSNASDTNSTNDSKQKKSTSGWDDFGYIGTASFFITITASISLIAGIIIIGEKLGMSIIPGILFPLFIFQVIFCFESDSKDFKEFFRSFGWSHLHFYQPIKVSSRRTMDLLSTQLDSSPIFLENIQYWVFLLLFLLCTSLVLCFLLPKNFLLKTQKLIYFYFYLSSLIPILYFSIISLSNPEFPDALSIISYIFSALTLIVYVAVFIYLGFVIFKSSLFVSVLYDNLTAGIVRDKIKVNRQRTNDSRAEEIVPNVPERMSLDDNSGRCDDEATSGRRNLDKTDIRIQSAPISVYKYELPERFEQVFVEEVQFPWLFYIEIAGFACVAAELAVFQGIYLVGYCLAVVILAFLMSVIAYRPAFHYSCYKFVHIWTVLFLVLIAGVLLSTSEVILGSVYYFIILTIIAIVVLYVHQFVVMILEWIKIDNVEVKEFSISHQDVSISYVRDSIPEEKAPGSATINNISCDISMSVLRDH